MFDFFKHLHDHIAKHLVVNAVIVWLQIPHMVWAADSYLQAGLIARYNPVLDFLLYGVDLLEVVTIVYITSLIVAEVKARKANYIRSR